MNDNLQNRRRKKSKSNQKQKQKFWKSDFKMQTCSWLLCRRVVTDSRAKSEHRLHEKHAGLTGLRIFHVIFALFELLCKFLPKQWLRGTNKETSKQKRREDKKHVKQILWNLKGLLQVTSKNLRQARKLINELNKNKSKKKNLIQTSEKRVNDDTQQRVSATELLSKNIHTRANMRNTLKLIFVDAELSSKYFVGGFMNLTFRLRNLSRYKN